MSFKIAQFFYLLVSFLLAFFFFLLGAFTTALPWSPYLQEGLINFISTNTWLLSVFGPAFALIGLSLFFYAFLGAKKRYAYIQTGEKSTTIDEVVIQHYLESYWQEQFPKAYVPSQLTIKKHSIQIIADLPYLPKQEQKAFLDRVRQDFGDLFGRHLGCQHTIHLLASFASDPAQKS